MAGDTAGSSLHRLSSLQDRIYNLFGACTLSRAAPPQFPCRTITTHDRLRNVTIILRGPLHCSLSLSLSLSATGLCRHRTVAPPVHLTPFHKKHHHGHLPPCLGLGLRYSHGVRVSGYCLCLGVRLTLLRTELGLGLWVRVV